MEYAKTDLLINLCSPPFQPGGPAWVDEAEEDDDDAKGEAGVERGG